MSNNLEKRGYQPTKNYGYNPSGSNQKNGYQPPSQQSSPQAPPTKDTGIK